LRFAQVAYFLRFEDMAFIFFSIIFRISASDIIGSMGFIFGFIGIFAFFMVIGLGLDL
jgi:hypothetical protein